MIKSIKLLKANSQTSLDFLVFHDYQVEIESSFLDASFSTLQIEFESSIKYFRNHDYTWQKTDHRLLANWYAPKILMLENKQLVQANQHLGIWEVNPLNKHVLLWHFNPENAAPMAQYQKDNSKQIIQAVSSNKYIIPLALLLPLKEGIEVSRSKIPFSAIACFTDHCDFDTLANLETQRHFFKTHQIKITKGFFLNHYSKRADTASFECHENELRAWQEDGHELAYHSLSQSIKPLDESINDFNKFEPPFKNLNTWIDHGFQPYNLSLYANYEQLKKDYVKTLKKINIQICWNYIDSGTATQGVINQINPRQFTLQTYYKGLKHLRYRKRVPLFIKNVIFHYYNTDVSIHAYQNLAKYFKTFKNKKPIKKHFGVLPNLFKIFRLLIPILLFWKTRKHQVYPLANYTPVIFNQDVNGELFTVFQTLEMIDFKLGLKESNVDLLIKEKGLFIAHTYFSAPLEHHQGKFFAKNNEVDKQVEQNFSYLSKKIISQDVWNPTLSELVTHLKNYSNISFECNDKGEVFVLNTNQLAYRKVH